MSHGQLHGVVEDCRCSVDVVDKMNANIYPFMETLLQSDFFKFYKVKEKIVCVVIVVVMSYLASSSLAVCVQCLVPLLV